MANLLEMCKFKQFWEEASKSAELASAVQGFDDAIRKYVSHVVNITYQTIENSILKELLGITDGNFYLLLLLQLQFNILICIESDQALKQWITKCGWKDQGNGRVFITSQDDLVKTKNITEKVEFENVAGIMSHCV